ncbi:MAG TPA: carboxypeptidase-like regulatory domain-containing protein [Candidatus Bathyarchaeia archaeon]|nr:carboxypeptidase-like regulatory domain-containing protein [Candidatus Bathyarchaeia archaeon]
MESTPEDKPSTTQNAGQPEKEVKPEEVVEKIAEGSITGEIACIEGPVANATVSLGMIKTFSDAKGKFILEHVPVGIGKIRVKPRSDRFYESILDIIIESDNRKDVSIFLNEVTGTVEGTVSDENGKPLGGAEVSGLFRPAREAIVTKSDEKGRYMFANVPRGTYYVRAKAQGYMLEGVTVNVTAGGTFPANFALKPGALSISGRVLGKEGTPLDCEMYLMRKGVVVMKGGTSSSVDGQYAFTDLIPDTYEIIISSPGHMGGHWVGELKKAEMVNFELEIIQEITK